jgi:hypothetical protein
MNLDALIHRKFPPITQQYDAKGSRPQEIPPSKASYSRGFRGEGISGAARPSLRTSRFVCLKSVKSSPQEKRHH